MRNFCVPFLELNEEPLSRVECITTTEFDRGIVPFARHWGYKAGETAVGALQLVQMCMHLLLAQALDQQRDSLAHKQSLEAANPGGGQTSKNK